MFSCQQRDINQALIQDLAGAAEDTHTHTHRRDLGCLLQKVVVKVYFKTSL